MVMLANKRCIGDDSRMTMARLLPLNRPHGSETNDPVTATYEQLDAAVASLAARQGYTQFTEASLVGFHCLQHCARPDAVRQAISIARVEAGWGDTDEVGRFPRLLSGMLGQATTPLPMERIVLGPMSFAESIELHPLIISLLDPSVEDVGEDDQIMTLRPVRRATLQYLGRSTNPIGRLAIHDYPNLLVHSDYMRLQSQSAAPVRSLVATSYEGFAPGVPLVGLQLL